jgi:hypothetical protein
LCNVSHQLVACVCVCVCVCMRTQEFVNRHMMELAKRWKYEVRKSLPYRSQTNGAVEKQNHTLERALQSYMLDYRTKKFMEILPFIVFSYNTTSHGTTKFTPWSIHKCQEPKLPSIDWKSFQDEKNDDDLDAESEEDGETDRSGSPKASDKPNSQLGASRVPTVQKDADGGGAEEAKEDAEDAEDATNVRARVPVAASSAASAATSASAQEKLKPQIHTVTDNVHMEASALAAAAAAVAANSIPSVLQQDLSTEDPSPEEVEAYVKQSQELKSNAQAIVAKRINDAADAMVMRSAAKFSSKKNPRLQIGARVRLDMMAITHFRKQAKSYKRPKMEAANWSTEIYTVVGRTDATKTSPDVYTIVDAEGNPPEKEDRKRQYFRYSLMIVHDEQLEKLHGLGDRPDWNFGVYQRGSHREEEDAVNDEHRLGSDEERKGESPAAGQVDAVIPASASGSPSRPQRSAAAPKSARGFYNYY